MLISFMIFNIIETPSLILFCVSFYFDNALMEADLKTHNHGDIEANDEYDDDPNVSCYCLMGRNETSQRIDQISHW